MTSNTDLHRVLVGKQMTDEEVIDIEVQDLTDFQAECPICKSKLEYFELGFWYCDNCKEVFKTNIYLVEWN